MQHLLYRCALPGLGLYYLSNTFITTSIQVWLRKLGGADVKVNELGPITKVGTGEPQKNPFSLGSVVVTEVYVRQKHAMLSLLSAAIQQPYC